MDIVKKALKTEYTIYLMVGAILVIGLLNVFFAEKIQLRGGLGGDGQHYGDIAANFVERITEQQLNSYRIQRIVPSGIVYGVLSWFEIPLSIPNIIRGFDLLNVFLLAISAWVWGLIAEELRISTKGKWLGFTILFINSCFLKFNAYYPVLTDTTAFTLGMLMLLAYLKNLPVALLMLTLVGAFTWPTLLYCGILLIIFPRKTVLSMENQAIPSIASSFLDRHKLNLSVVLAGILATLWMSFAVYIWYFRPHPHLHLDENISFMLEFINFNILIIGIYTFLATRPLFLSIMTYRFNYTYFFSSNWLMRIISALFIFIAVKLLIGYLSFPLEGFDFKRYLHILVGFGFSKPFVFGVTHIFYYGPAIFIAAFALTQCSNYVVQYGLGISLLWLIGIVFAIGPESRHLINFFPIFAIVVIKVLDELPLAKKFYIAFLITSFLFSKVYITINTGLSSSLSRWYSSLIGYNISNKMYLTEGIVLVFIVFFFYFEFFNKPPFTTNKRLGEI